MTSPTPLIFSYAFRPDLQFKSIELKVILFFILTFVLTNSQNYSAANFGNEFKAFKVRYNKVYKNINEEQSRYRNFVKNLNKVTELNEVTKDNTTFFTVNQYADLDPEDIEEHYGINVKPYTNVQSNNTKDLISRTHGNVHVNWTKMYDLYNVDKLFDEYVKTHKRNLTNKYDRTVHYYRFIKTLVDKNKKILEDSNIDDIKLDNKADIVKEPYEYFY